MSTPKTVAYFDLGSDVDALKKYHQTLSDAPLPLPIIVGPRGCVHKAKVLKTRVDIETNARGGCYIDRRGVYKILSTRDDKDRGVYFHRYSSYDDERKESKKVVVTSSILILSTRSSIMKLPTVEREKALRGLYGEHFDVVIVADCPSIVIIAKNQN